MNSYSIRQNGVQAGPWTDHSTGALLVTLPVKEAVYLVAAIAFFLAVCGARVWTIQRFFIHHYLAGKTSTDGLGVQQRVLIRNGGSELSTIWELGMMRHAWRESKPSAKGVWRRTLILALFPLVNVVAFSLISVFSPKITGGNYVSNHVLLEPMNCGTLVPNLGLNGTKLAQLNRLLIQTALNDTQVARQYAHDCYGSGHGSGQCSMFPSQSVPYSTDIVDCPFGRTPAGINMCQPNADKAFQLTTDSLDTGKIFGVNVPAKNQIEVRKRLTCAPIQVSEYVQTDNPELGDAITYLNLGPVLGLSTYTIPYRPQAKTDGIGYQLFSLTSGGGAIWSPVDALKVPHGDVSITVLAGNSIQYLAPVKDPWFSANKLNNYSKTYMSDSDLSVIGCVDQFQICNPSAGGSSTCTILGSSTDVFTAQSEIGLNKYQAMLAVRMLSVLSNTYIWQAVDAQGVGALLASRETVGLTSDGLPDNQWELEVRDWFTTSLANMQATVVQYVNNLDPAALGGYFSIAKPNAHFTGVPEDYLCNAQRVRNTGGYVSFSFAWLMVIFWVGITLIGLSFAMESVLNSVLGVVERCFKKNLPRRDVVRTADLLLQISRVALEAERRANDKQWARKLKDVPITAGDRMFLLPEPRMDTDGDSKDFLPTRPEAIEMVQGAEEVGSDSQPRQDAATAGELEAQRKKGLLPIITIDERLETQSLMSEVMDEVQRRSTRPESSWSSVSALTDG